MGRFRGSNCSAGIIIMVKTKGMSLQAKKHIHGKREREREKRTGKLKIMEGK